MLFLFLPQLQQRRQVFERGGVAGPPAGGKVAEEAADDLARLGFGEDVGEADVIRDGVGADFFADVQLQFLFQFLAGLVVGLERDEGGDSFAFDLVGAANARGFGDLGVRDEG
jgi:hypothetical protein